MEARTKERTRSKIIVRVLMRKMVHRTPTTIFHLTNSATLPIPRDNDIGFD
jgi:hypothetical protein